MISIAHPLADELLGLVASDERATIVAAAQEKDTSWFWMSTLLVAIGALAWFTR